MTLIEELRAKESRDNRDLLDRAADTIDELNIQLEVALSNMSATRESRCATTT
jgi:hypothetical protein